MNRCGEASNEMVRSLGFVGSPSHVKQRNEVLIPAPLWPIMPPLVAELNSLKCTICLYYLD